MGMTYVQELYAQFLVFMENNPVVAGAISLWGLGVLTFLVKVITEKFWPFLKYQLITSVFFNSSSHNKLISDNALKFMKWFHEYDGIKWSRTLSIDNVENDYDDDDVLLGAGWGRHYFIWNGKLFWADKMKLDSQGTAAQKFEIKISTFGRSSKPIEKLVREFSIQPTENDMKVYRFEYGHWEKYATIKHRDFNTVIMNKQLKQNIIDQLDHFYSSEEWYESKGIPYKKTYILHGEPGTGKTSIISGIASKYRKHLCVLDFNEIPSTTALQVALQTVPKNCIVVIEDFDSCEATKTRESDSSIIDRNNLKNTMAGVSLNTSAILNALDGIIRLHGVVVFMTTNHLEQIDPAVLRKGRVDHIYKIEPFQDEEIKEYFTLVYGKHFPESAGRVFGEIKGCDIQALFLEYPNDHKTFFEKLPKYRHTEEYKHKYGSNL